MITKSRLDTTHLAVVNKMSGRIITYKPVQEILTCQHLLS